MPQRRSTTLVLIVALALAGCSTTPEAASSVPTDSTMRAVAPERLHIGTAVSGGGHAAGLNAFDDDPDYRALLAAEFSSLTPENQLKWEYLRPDASTFRFDDADAIVEFAEQNGQAVRGHTLLWHSQNPAWLENGGFSDDELREILREHISTVVGRYAGRIYEWDVANEIFDDNAQLRTADNIWLERFGIDIIAEALRWAHEADPTAVLFLNDYNVESIGPKSDAYYELAIDLIDAGVPLGGFGIQGHLSTEYPHPADLRANLQRFATLGLDVAITELDVRMALDGAPTAEQLAEQATRYGDVLAACLAVSTCTSFTVWGAGDGLSWVPFFFEGEGAATPWADDYARKPAYDALWRGLSAAGGSVRQGAE